MGSLLSPLDLNLSPASSSSGALPRPKMEPKREPFDDPASLQDTNFYLTANLLPSSPETHFLEPFTPMFHSQPDTFPFQPVPSPQDNNVYQTTNLLPSSPETYFPEPFTPNFPSQQDTFPYQPLPEPSTPNFPSQLDTFPNQPFPSPLDDNVYSDYARIWDMFRSTFNHKTQQQKGDVHALEPESGAIVVPSASRTVVPTNIKRQYQKRSCNLVRIMDMTPEQDKGAREGMRRIRTLFDSLRLFATSEEVKRLGPGMVRRARGDLRAATILRERGLWLHRDKRIVGPVPGIHVGDVFFFRMEMCVVALHGQTQAGIDFLPASQSPNRQPIATSIIVSGGYEDDDDSGEVLTYTGHGGQDKFGKQCCDQKLEGGNLALERSMHYGIEIRVVRGLKYPGSLTTKVYVYDGLYKITKTYFDVGKSGFGVYKFMLVRIEGQPEMGSCKLKYAQALRSRPLDLRPKGYLTLDLSQKKEHAPIFLYNDIDSDYFPMCCEYLGNTVFPSSIFHSSGNGPGCTCVNGCTYGCVCSVKNGGEFPYDQHGLLLRPKPLIFECGPNCQCPPSCQNRVSQRGLRHRLEVFRSRETSWAVRTLDLIHAGSFICEYTGVVLTKEQAQILSMSGDSLIYPGRFAARSSEWGDLSQVSPEYVRPSYPSLPPLEFAMDVSQMRNVACYIANNSECPNILVQFVLYDHDNMMFPHIMLFAEENISPMSELTIDYGVPNESTGNLSICYH